MSGRGSGKGRVAGNRKGEKLRGQGVGLGMEATKRGVPQDW